MHDGASAAARDGSMDLADDFIWIRCATLSTMLVSVGGLLWLWSLLYATRPSDFWPGWGIPFSLLILVGACFLVKEHNYRLAAVLFTGTLFVGTLLLLVTPDTKEVAPFLFVAAVLVAGTLLGGGAAFGTAILASAVLAGAAALAPRTVAPPNAVGALALVWIGALTAWVTTRGLYTALRWAWTNSEQASRNLEKSRRVQGQLTAALRQLEEATYRLEQSNHALAWARAEAEAARRVKAEFAAHVSHELRTPINLIVGFAELILGAPEVYGGDSLPAAYLADLTALNRSAKHLQGLIDDILDISQVDAGEMPVLRDLTDIGAIIHEAVATTRRLLESKGLTISVDVANDLPLLSIDRLRIRQALLNLLSNAARFTEHGGVTVRAARQASDVIVQVTDTGPGISPRDLAKVFEAFHQVDNRTRCRLGGTGLGLAISKRFVELHGGRIWAESDEIAGHGTTFSFTLPIPTDGETEVSVPSEPFTFRKRRRLECSPPSPTVVVVDDDPAVVSLFQRRLEGYQIAGARSPAEGIALARRLSAHAIVTDVTGAADLDAWHREWLQGALPAGLRLLGCPMPSGRRLAHTLGLVDLLVKPVTRESLLRSVRGLVPNGATILIVDDDAQMVRLLCRMLRSASQRYRLRRAYGGEQAIEVMRKDHPDLVLLDILMPRVDGISLLERMRQDAHLADVPVIAVSARGVLEAISPSASRTFVLVTDTAPSVSGLLRLVQTELDSLPPVLPDSPAEQESPGELAASEAS